MPFQTITAPEFSEEFKEMSRRRNDLAAIEPVDTDGMIVLSEMWSVLCTDFDNEGHPTLAAMCAKRSSYWARRASGY